MKLRIISYRSATLGKVEGLTTSIELQIKVEADLVKRKELKEKFRNIFTNLWETEVTVLFEDECPNCGEIMDSKEEEYSYLIYICKNLKCKEYVQ